MCWTQQKVLDEFISNLILMLRNLGVGRYLAKDGALDEDQITQLHGAILRLNDGFQISDIEHIPAEQIPPSIGEFINFITQIMVEMMPSLSGVFTGEAPFAGASGRAVQSLQFANFNQLIVEYQSNERVPLETQANPIDPYPTVCSQAVTTTPVAWRSRRSLPVPR